MVMAVCRRHWVAVRTIGPLLLALLLLSTGAIAEQAATLATFCGDGTLVVDGQPVFPIGMHTEELESIERIAGAGFNLVSGSGEWGEQHYAASEQEGLLVLGGHYVWATFASFRSGGGIDLRPSEAAGVQNVIRHARDQSRRLPLETLAAFDHLPGVIGWRTNEEPEAKLVESLEYAYEVFKSHSPGHIVATLSCDPRWFHLFRNTADVLIVDNYPFRGNRGAKRSLLETYEWISHAKDVMGGKPVWLMSQLIPPSYWSLDPADELSLQDMRLQSYLGLIAGAKGIIMYNYEMFMQVRERDADGDARLRPAGEDLLRRRWSAVRALVEELKALAPIICGGRLSSDLEIRWLQPGAQGPGPQMTRELDHYGRKYLLIANPLDVPIEGRVFGINGGNRRAFDAGVFCGDRDLSVRTETPGEPTITVGPRGTGTFVLTRRPVVAEE